MSAMPASIRTMVEEISRGNQAGHPVVEHLQKELANSSILYFNYKHYHWQTFGPLFRDLHLMFDEFAKANLEMIDEFAERVRMIGQDPIFEFQQFQKSASVQAAKPGQNLRRMIEEADANLISVIKDMRDAARTADEHNDPGTVDLFSKMVQVHEKHEWFLREILKSGDGLAR